MFRKPRRCRPVLEGLEPRLALSTTAAVATQGTVAVLQAFTRAYLSRAGEPRYDPAFDLNHNGQIGQVDGRLLLHALPPVGPNIPLNLTVTLAPEDQAGGSLPKNSGGITHHKNPTVVGHTTPGSLIFIGTGTVDLKLRGPAYVADANGNYAFKMNLTDGINQLDLLAVDPFGHQRLRAFPIYWLDFARYENAHPAKT